MDPPKTRRESKKDQKEKAEGKDGKYTQKHIRLAENRRLEQVLQGKKSKKS